MSKENLFFKPTIYVILAIYIAFTFTVLAMGDKVLAATIPEDHLFEMVGSFSLFVTSLVFFYGFTIARKSLHKTRNSLVKQMLYLALAVLFFFGAGEEISWGQRILGFETPEAVAEVNKQGELNIHNMTIWQNSKLDANSLFDAFWFLFAVFIPALALLAPSFKQLAGRFIPVVHWGIGLLFLYNYLWAKLAKIIYMTAYTFDRISLTQAVQEIKESNYAVIFILVGFFAVLDLTRS